MRKIPSEDKTLYDHIKELYESWRLDQDDVLIPVRNFEHDFLKGYFCCYYKGDPKHITDAMEYFDEMITAWEMENDRLENEE